jgi:hypothetical protein
VAAKRQREDDLVIAVGQEWRSGDDDRCSLPGPLVLQESQFLSHPGVPERGRRYPIAVDAGCHVAGDAAASASA